MAQAVHELLLKKFRDTVQNHHWTITNEREVTHGTQLTISDEKNTVPVIFYYKGTIQIQGAESQLRQEISTWKKELQSTNTKPIPTDNKNLWEL